MHDDPTSTALRQMMEMQARSVQDFWQNLMPSALAPPAQPAPDMAQNELDEVEPWLEALHAEARRRGLCV